ncbi:14296_t:CDS:2, partial [Funneliformis caledonium]
DNNDTVRKRDKRIQSLKYLTDELYKLVKEGIIPQVLSAIQEMENDPIFQDIITFIPVVGTSYKLISSAT